MRIGRARARIYEFAGSAGIDDRPRPRLWMAASTGSSKAAARLGAWLRESVDLVARFGCEDALRVVEIVAPVLRPAAESWMTPVSPSRTRRIVGSDPWTSYGLASPRTKPIVPSNSFWMGPGARVRHGGRRVRGWESSSGCRFRASARASPGGLAPRRVGRGRRRRAVRRSYVTKVRMDLAQRVRRGDVDRAGERRPHHVGCGVEEIVADFEPGDAAKDLESRGARRLPGVGEGAEHLGEGELARDRRRPLRELRSKLRSLRRGNDEADDRSRVEVDDLVDGVVEIDLSHRDRAPRPSSCRELPSSRFPTLRLPASRGRRRAARASPCEPRRGRSEAPRLLGADGLGLARPSFAVTPRDAAVARAPPAR